VGLVANALEAAGISTILITVRPEITTGVGAPRSMYVRFPLGNSVGEPGRSDQQRTILLAAFDALQRLDQPGLMVEAPFRWRRM
jgi:hypothetical protein